MLESARNLNIDQIIITSTSETYGSAKYTPIDENHPLKSQSPYAASKVSSDQLALSYFRSFDLPVKIIRPFNVYGPRQSTRAIIPTIISQLIEQKRILKLGNLNVKRDFTFVTDTCDAFLSILKLKKYFGETFNVGMNNNISVKDLVEIISKKLKFDYKIKVDKKRVRPIKSEVNELLCDNSKILKLTKWKPKFNLSKGLDLTIDWIKNNKDKYNSNNYHV